jgi:hypothetical protein
VDGLMRNLGDVEPEVRREAVIALAHYRNHDLLPALRSALRDVSRPCASRGGGYCGVRWVACFPHSRAVR